MSLSVASCHVYETKKFQNFAWPLGEMNCVNKSQQKKKETCFNMRWKKKEVCVNRKKNQKQKGFPPPL